MTVHQIMANAGDGRLNDGSECSKELRHFFTQIDSEKLNDYIDQCLEEKPDKYENSLQDLVNELGRRLDFQVTNGRYRGRKGLNGFDGFWKSPEGNGIVVEVKTSTAFQIKLATTESYRKQLISDENQPNNVSILVVTADPNTEDLEAQIRGSRYAWDVRVISINGLQRLVAIKEKSDENETVKKIQNLLIPFEYTRLDSIVDLVFTTALDVEQADTESLSDTDTSSTLSTPSAEKKIDITPVRELEFVRKQAITIFNTSKNSNLIKKTRATYSDQEQNIIACCTVSKRYDNLDCYWYAFHPHWKDFLDHSNSSFLILAFVDREDCIAIPYHLLKKQLEHLNTSTRPNGTMYWHIKLRETNDDKLALVLPKIGSFLELDEFWVSTG